MFTQPALAQSPAERTARSDRFEALAPRPRVLQDTGLGSSFLADLIAKHLLQGGVCTLNTLARRLALPGSLVEQALVFLRAEGLVEVRGAAGQDLGLRYLLTERGTGTAKTALERGGYVGPAPIPLGDYERLVAAQSATNTPISREAMHAAFRNVVIRESLLDALGPAVNSGRAIFIYGPPGTGKSFIARKLSAVLGDPILVPFAILVEDTIIQVFDSAYHHPLEPEGDVGRLFLNRGHDPRYVLCERPVIVTGGELTLDLLDLQFHPVSRRFKAPLQLRANNGMLMIDDFGRQRASPVDLMNRGIVPLEENRDFLSLPGGEHFAVPFDLVLVLSTNLNPADLVDDAFLRRMGSKIHFDALERGQYVALWGQVCERDGVPREPGALDFLIDELHGKHGVPLTPSHARDLLKLLSDRCRYLGLPVVLSREGLISAWDNHMIR